MDRRGPAGAERDAHEVRDWVGVARRSVDAAPTGGGRAGEHCELCNAPIPSAHRHLLELSSRELVCACRPCSLLFDRDGASAGRYKLVPERRLRLEDFAMSEQAWEELRIPVDMAFFFHSSVAGRVLAYYPGPMGPTESQLQLSSWRELEPENPILGELEADVEALLVNRVRGARRQWLVPLGRLLRPRGADPHALAGPDGGQRGVAADRWLL